MSNKRAIKSLALAVGSFFAIYMIFLLKESDLFKNCFFSYSICEKIFPLSLVKKGWYYG